MVTPDCYPVVRRYGTRMNIYPSYPERRGTGYPIHTESRTIMSDRDEPQRKRIAVACGRCRKRKIRCSGDTGTGEPCTNCKNAGYEPCQFLRVASTETIYKTENFTYSLDASRQYQARGSSAISSVPVTTHPLSDPDGLPAYTSEAGEAFAYRAPANLAYETKPYCPLPWGNGYADDQSYGLAMYPQSYPVHDTSAVHDADYSMSYRIASGTSGKSALCVDTDPDYAYSSGNNVTSLVHRPAPVTTDSTSLAYQNMVPEPKSFGYQNLAADSKGLAMQNMAAGVNMGDRVLPMPVGRSSMSSSTGSLYKHDSGSSIYSSSKSSQASTSDTSPVSSTSEPTSSYTTGNYESSSMASTSSCLPSYPPIAMASQYGRSSNDHYSHTGSSDASLFASTDSLRPGPDMTYRYTDTTTAVTAAAAASSSARYDLPHLNGSGLGSFSLGHGAASYLPHSPAAYMLPSDIGPDNATVNYRKGAGSLRA
ncbi:uncharacterized protein FIESC28_02937 [Fusarium coffeatum]|uniref:Zn(2)-C6 fungal-type domain-containing protein n=1 Tax=Fusarium coffeatum TaxID=231269 RepID=A0A366S4G0_9HYPO|nr:uncharacterized protein FIESC28_02937 [Fusarium coffeatum]RBR24204.1 hypothetical protein FIESC28_02937 [Fusarium coffeatum]